MVQRSGNRAVRARRLERNVTIPTGVSELTPARALVAEIVGQYERLAGLALSRLAAAS